MSKERVKEFYAAASEDEGLQRKLKAALEGCRGMEPGAAIEKAVLPVAASAGFEFSAEDVAELEKELAEGGEASDADLAAVSGGSVTTPFALCFIVGAGMLPGGQIAGAGICFFAGTTA